MPISPESDYCLSGMVECLDNTVDTYTGAFAGKIDADHILETTRDSQAFAIAVKTAVLNWRTTTATPFQKGLMGFSGLFETGSQVHEAILTIKNELIDRHLQCLNITQPPMVRGLFRHRSYPNLPPIQTRDDMFNPTIIREIAGCDSSLTRWCGFMAEQHERNLDAFRQISFADFLAEYRDYHLVREETVVIDDEEICTTPDGVVGNAMLASVRRALRTRKQTKSARKALRRSINLSSRIIGKENVHTFIAGNEIIITGALYNYKVRRDRDNLISHTANPHGMAIPYSLVISTKDGTPLGSGCIYFEDTPIIDQIIALSNMLSPNT